MCFEENLRGAAGPHLGETGPVSAGNTTMTADVLGCVLQGGPSPAPGQWAWSQGDLWKAAPSSWEVTLQMVIVDDAPCPSAPLLQREGWHPYVLRDMVPSGFAKQHSGLGSWPGIQAQGGTRPVGATDSLASLAFSDWPSSQHVLGTSFGSDLYS